MCLPLVSPTRRPTACPQCHSAKDWHDQTGSGYKCGGCGFDAFLSRRALTEGTLTAPSLDCLGFLASEARKLAAKGVTF